MPRNAVSAAGAAAGQLAGPPMVYASGTAAAAGEWFSKVRPGCSVALLYADEPDLWHEALVTWPGQDPDKRPLAILTPDGTTM